MRKSVLTAVVLSLALVGNAFAQTVTMHFPFSNQRDSEKVFAAASQYVKSKIGIDVQFVPYDGFDNYNQKMILQTTAGDVMDLLWTSHWNFVYTDQIAKNSFLPLDDLLPKYMPTYYKYVPKAVWDILRYSDGKIYTVPFMEYPVRQNGMWFKKDLAEKYKLDVKAVEKDFRALEPWLAAVKKGEPQITPLAVGANTSVSWAFESFAPYVQVFANSVVLKSNPKKVVNVWDQPYNVEFMKTMNKWYKAGYVRDDAFTVKDIAPEVKALKYAAGATVISPDAEAKFKAENGFDVVIARFGKPMVARDSVAGSQFAVSRTSKNPVNAVKVLELLDSDKVFYNLLSYGIEGTHFKKTGANTLAKIADSGYDPNMTWVFGNTHLAYLQPGVSDKTVSEAQTALKNAELKLYADFVFDQSPIKTVEAAWGTIYTEIGESLGIGIFDPAKDLPGILEKQKKIELNKEIAEVQKQLDAYLAKKK